MGKTKFTAGRVADYKCEAGKSQSFLWDRGAPGLGLRATASASRAYLFQSKLTDKTIRITKRGVSTWPIDKAQAEARRLKTLIDVGVDPRQVRADSFAAKQEARDSVAPSLA